MNLGCSWIHLADIEKLKISHIEGIRETGREVPMSITELQEKQEAAKAQVKHLWERLHEGRQRLADTDVATYARGKGHSTVAIDPCDLICCRTLQGHTGKVYSLDWSRERDCIVSASQDGQLIVWNALTSQKIHAIKLPSPWVTACAFSPNGEAVACGGLDTVCSIFKLSSHPKRDGSLPYHTLHGHKGYISCCKYLYSNEAQLVTSSRDCTCALWDSETCQRLAIFGGDASAGHSADVMSVSASPCSPLFVSGSGDKTARLWDTRMASSTSSVRTFYGHRSDVNTVCFSFNGSQIGTGSDDGTCRLFDMRTGHQLQVYSAPQTENEVANVTSVAFSFSARLLFASYSNGDCLVWDAVNAEIALNIKELRNGHFSRISCLGLVSDGSALCTGSWDQTLKIWAFGGEKAKMV